MAHIANLTPWEKGQSGNPSGRPKGARNRSTIVREWLEVRATDGDSGQVADQLVRALIKKAASGDVYAFKELMDSAFGKIKDEAKVEHSYTQMPMIEIDGQPLEFKGGKSVADAEVK